MTKVDYKAISNYNPTQGDEIEIRAGDIVEMEHS
jgi:hypothetical protein